MAQPLIAEHLSNINRALSSRLDDLAKLLPEQKQPRRQLPFDQYLQRAQAVAARDPEFRQRLDLALAQYRAGGKTDATK